MKVKRNGRYIEVKKVEWFHCPKCGNTNIYIEKSTFFNKNYGPWHFCEDCNLEFKLLFDKVNSKLEFKDDQLS